MKRKQRSAKFVLIGLCLFGLTAAKTSVQAQKETPISIRIVETPIRLEKVSAPTFGTYERSVRSQELRATSDLTIQVKDLRENKKTPWRLYYQLSSFSNGKEYAVFLDLGKGHLRTLDNGQEVSSEPKKVSLRSNETKTLVTAYSTKASEYRYRINKQAIKLTIPGNLPEGDFVAKQTVTLVNIPEAN